MIQSIRLRYSTAHSVFSTIYPRAGRYVTPRVMMACDAVLVGFILLGVAYLIRAVLG